MALRFDGRVAVVTGAGSGLGRAYALMLASRGAKVVVNDLGGSTNGTGSSTAAADVVVEEIKKAGGEATPNYNSVEDGEAIVKTAITAYGRVDIVINNAGILRDVSFKKMTDKDWDLIHSVHMRGTYAVTHAAWNAMLEQKYGRIVNVASAAGIYGNYGQSNYSAAKLGIVGFTNAIALEGAKSNIKANCIAPIAGSRMTATVLPSEFVDLLKPEYVAPVVTYLASEACEESGQLIETGAGWIGKLRWQRTKGHNLPLEGFAAEDVQGAWSTISKWDEAENPTNMMDTMGKVLARVQKPSKL